MMTKPYLLNVANTDPLF